MINIFELSFLKDRGRSAVLLAGLLAAFLCLYFSVFTGSMREIALYFLMLIGLFFGFNWPETSLVTNGMGALLLVTTVHPLVAIPVLSQLTLFVISIMVPFYFDRILRLERASYLHHCQPLREQEAALTLKCATFEQERQDLETDIERINQIYVLGRELVEHTETSSVIDNLQRVLLGRPGMRAVAIYLRENDAWVCAYCSRKEEQRRWLDYLQVKKSVNREHRFHIIPTNDPENGEKIIYWPVWLEKQLLAVIILTAENSVAERYRDEGEIFIPQIALGLRRTKLFAEVQERSRNDGLTGLYLRRYFLERLLSEIQRSKRYSTGFALMMADIDLFKQVNDTYGHLAGDDVLKGLAAVLKERVRPGDLICRYGGEEFVILTPIPDTEEVMRSAEALRSAVENATFVSSAHTLHITISLGVAHYPQNGTSPEDLLSSVDKAMYYSKTHGRNQVTNFRDIGT